MVQLPIRFVSHSNGWSDGWCRTPRQQWLTHGEIYSLIHDWVDKYYCPCCDTISINRVQWPIVKSCDNEKCTACGRVGLEPLIDEYDAMVISSHQEHQPILPDTIFKIQSVVCYCEPGSNEADNAYLAITYFSEGDTYGIKPLSFTPLYRVKTWRGLRGANVIVTHLMKGCGLE